MADVPMYPADDALDDLARMMGWRHLKVDTPGKGPTGTTVWVHRIRDHAYDTRPPLNLDVLANFLHTEGWDLVLHARHEVPGPLTFGWWATASRAAYSPYVIPDDYGTPGCAAPTAEGAATRLADVRLRQQGVAPDRQRGHL